MQVEKQRQAYVVADFEALDVSGTSLRVVALLYLAMALPRAPLRRELRVEHAVEVDGVARGDSLRTGVAVLGLLPLGEPRLALPATAASHKKST